MTQSLAGKFLIAETDMTDPNFTHSVIFMVQHNESGAFGLMVNSFSGLEIKEVTDFPFDPLINFSSFFVGGPVENEIFFSLRTPLIHESRLDELIIFPNKVVFDPNIMALNTEIETQKTEFFKDDADFKIKLFSGYSGWGPGQVEEELKEKAWLVSEMPAVAVFAPNPENLWTDSLVLKGGLHWAYVKTGYKPSLN